jgi:hypothetical protein
VTTDETFSLSDLRSIEDLAAEYPKVLKPNTLRNQLRHRRANGLDACTVWVGRRLMVIKPRYVAWLASRTEVPA